MTKAWMDFTTKNRIVRDILCGIAPAPASLQDTLFPDPLLLLPEKKDNARWSSALFSSSNLQIMISRKQKLGPIQLLHRIKKIDNDQQGVRQRKQQIK